MAFQDTFPNQIEFEFDRSALRRCYRTQAALACTGLPLVFALLFTTTFYQKFLVEHWRLELSEKIGYACQFGIIGIGLGLLVSAVFYFAYFHWAADLCAKNVRLVVEGPFLRFVRGGYVVVDERYHFKDIHNYTTIEGPILRQFGLKTLTCTGSHPRTTMQVLGLKDPDQVRDILCELDVAREALWSAKAQPSL